MPNSGDKTEICFECLGHFLPLPAARASSAPCISRADLSNTHTSWSAYSQKKSCQRRHQLPPDQREEPVGRPHEATRDDSAKWSPCREHICGDPNQLFWCWQFEVGKGDTEGFWTCTLSTLAQILWQAHVSVWRFHYSISPFVSVPFGWNRQPTEVRIHLLNSAKISIRPLPRPRRWWCASWIVSPSLPLESLEIPSLWHCGSWIAIFGVQIQRRRGVGDGIGWWVLKNWLGDVHRGHLCWTFGFTQYFRKKEKKERRRKIHGRPKLSFDSFIESQMQIDSEYF